MSPTPQSVTTLLNLARQPNNAAARDSLYQRVRDTLRTIAQTRLARWKAPSWSATALVHEAWLRLTAPWRPPWDEREQFYATANLVMRDVLAEYYGRRRPQSVDDETLAQVIEDRGEGVAEALAREESVAQLLEAIERLHAHDPLAGEVCRRRVFGGLLRSLSVDEAAAGVAPEPGDRFLPLHEVADSLGLSVTTTHRRWLFALHFLRRQLRGALGEDH